MKKILVLALALFILPGVFAADVSQSFDPSRPAPGETVKVSMKVSNTAVGETFTIENQIPTGWNLQSWDVSGAEGGKDATSYRNAGSNRHGFSFTTSSASPTVTLTVTMPSGTSDGDYGFDAIYFDSSGQGRNQANVNVHTISCGDGTCEGSENSDNCAADCTPPPPPPPPSEPEPEAEEPEETEEEGGSNMLIIILVLAVIIGAGVYFFMNKKQPSGKKSKK